MATTSTAEATHDPGPDVAKERLPARRGRLDLLLAARASHQRAVGRTDASGLHLRHQGARVDDRAADRDEAAAEGHSDGTPARARGEAADLRQGSAGGIEGGGVGVVS